MFTHTPAFNSFAVPDLEQARRFYGDTLGLRHTVLDADAGLMTLHLAQDRDTFVYHKPDFRPATYTILNFEIDDVEAAVDALVERGVTVERYDGMDQDERGISRSGGPPIAWFSDPGGNILAILRTA